MAAPDAEKQLNVAGQDPRAEDLTDSQSTAGRDPAPRSRDRPAGELGGGPEHQGRRPGPPRHPRRRQAIRRRRLVPVLHRPRVRRRGLRADAAARARDVMDKRGRLDEINVVVDGGEPEIDAVERRLERALARGVEVDTPQGKSDEVESQLQAFNAILYFFAAMALFVGGFLIFNSFNMSVFQRTREIGMLRTLGATRAQDRRVGPDGGGGAGRDRGGLRPRARGRPGAGADRADALDRLSHRRAGADLARRRSPRS